MNASEDEADTFKNLPKRKKRLVACRPVIVHLHHMGDNEYQGGRTAGSEWGCMATTLIGTPIVLLLMIADALGDCVPDAVCKKGFWPSVVTPTFLVSVMVFFTVRLIVDRFRRSDES